MLMLQRNLMNSTVLPTPIVSQYPPQAPAEARKRCVRAVRGFTGQSDGPWVGGYVTCAGNEGQDALSATRFLHWSVGAMAGPDPS